MITEDIKRKAKGFGKLAPAFLEGAEFALNNQFISVEDDLPCNHEELMRSSFFTRTVLALSDENELEFAYMHKTVTDEWEWTSIRNVKYWMPIPEYQIAYKVCVKTLLHSILERC